MKRSYRLGMTLFVCAWLPLAAWVLLLTPAEGQTYPVVRGAQAGQEPPPEKTLWDRIGQKASNLLRRHDPNSPQEAVRLAALPLGVPDWHKQGQRGKGIKVVVLDSGFKNYKAALGKVLPAQVTVKSFRKDGQLEARESQHGILCAEVIHHLAPDVELLFANWEPETPDQFLAAVRWARQQGAQIISCSIIMPTWSDGEGGGAAHKELSALLGSGNKKGDGLFFASAGNTALRHWGGLYSPMKEGWHQWQKGKRENGIRPLGSERVSVELVGSGEACYEMVIRDTTADRDVESVRTVSKDHCLGGAIRFVPREGHRYSVRVRQINAEALKGKPPGKFHLTVLGGKLTSATKTGSIPFPGDGREVIAVAAAEAKGKRQGYSSCGPNGPCPKPDLCALVPFPSVWRPDQPFSGTSAATPQAAALAALIWSRYPSLTANQVRKVMEQAAVPATKGHCCESGHGIVRLPK